MANIDNETVLLGSIDLDLVHEQEGNTILTLE
jgi:hypothetical protein